MPWVVSGIVLSSIIYIYMCYTSTLICLNTEKSLNGIVYLLIFLVVES